MTREDLARPDNAGDTTIVLEISGNRLVAVLNTLDQQLHTAGLYRFEGDKVVAHNTWYTQLRETTEAIRDELSRQRTEQR